MENPNLIAFYAKFKSLGYLVRNIDGQNIIYGKVTGNIEEIPGATVHDLVGIVKVNEAKLSFEYGHWSQYKPTSLDFDNEEDLLNFMVEKFPL